MAKKPSVKANTKTNQTLPKRRGKRTLIFLVLLLLVVGGSFWARKTMNNPDAVFWGGVENNLRSLGATRHILQEDGNVITDQYIQFVTTVPHVAKGITGIKQNTNPPITIQTETIGTPYRDFVRYTKAETSQRTAKGGVEDFSSILNVWGESGTEPGSSTTGGQFYADSILNIIPSANLTYEQRKEVMKLMRDKVYTIDAKNVKKASQDGRPLYVYEVSINFEGYITALKQVAQYVGLSQLDDVDPSEFANRQPVSVEVAVDVWSRSVKRISILGGNRAEGFSSRGITTSKLDIPTQTLPLQELQRRINVIDQER